jgi:aldehyde dehydrogenase (NAD+)
VSVIKPASLTSITALKLGQLITEADILPPGVLQVVSGPGGTVGEELASSPLVDKVAFTGSTEVGRRIMQLASGTVKKVFLELGGKSANIILDDVDMKHALADVATVCTHSGQGCALTTRLLLPRSRYEEALAIAKHAFETFKYGDPMDPAHLQGPQVSKKQQQSVLAYIEIGKKEGARLACGGGVPKHLPKGYYVEPTLFVDVDPRMRIAQEEIFGPVLCAIPYRDDDDAVRIANDSIFGLSGAVKAKDEKRALAVARRIRTGTLGINHAQWFSVDTPFGGFRQSGVGRENGRIGFEEYLETKVIALPAR